MSRRLYEEFGTWNSTTQYTINSDLDFTTIPVVLNPTDNITYRMSNGIATVGVNPALDSAWESFGAASADISPNLLTINLILGNTITASSTATTLTLFNNTIFNTVISGSLITLTNDNAINLPKGYNFLVTVAMQGDTFSAAPSELQLYMSRSLNGGSYVDAASYLRNSSMALNTTTNLKGTASYLTVPIDTGSSGLNANVKILFKTIVVQTGDTAQITPNDQFFIRVSN